MIVSEQQIADSYARVTGVVGWKVRFVDGSRFEVDPPDGYALVSDDLGKLRIVKAPTNIGIFLGKTEG